MKYVTLSRSHPDFHKYLNGSFSDSLRALPLPPLSSAMDSEFVTFELHALSQISRPTKLNLLLSFLKPLPLLHVLVLYFWILQFSPFAALDLEMALLLFVSLVVSVLTLGFWNDIHDFKTGYDQARAKRGNQALKKGWISLTAFQKIFYASAAISILLSCILILLRPIILWILALASLLCLFLFVNQKKSVRDVSFHQIILFFIWGPLLGVGMSLTLTGSIDVRVLFFSSLWGFAGLFVRHVEDFENLLVEGKAGRSTWVSSLGFDRSLFWIPCWWLASIGLWIGFNIYFKNHWWLHLFGVLLGAVSFYKFSLWRKVPSPVSSNLSKIVKEAKYLYLTFVVLWVLQALWSL